MSQTLTAKGVRIILLILMFLMMGAIIGGFVYAQSHLRGYAASISRLNADAQSGDQNIATLRRLETTISEKQLAIDNAHALVADNATYADQAIQDITRIAAQSGVSIASFDFVEPAATATTPSAAAPATTPATAQPAAGAINGVTKKTISVAIASPLKYTSLMKFIQGIETNKLKMQIASVSMSKEEGDNVGTQTFSVEVYVR